MRRKNMDIITFLKMISGSRDKKTGRTLGGGKCRESGKGIEKRKKLRVVKHGGKKILLLLTYCEGRRMKGEHEVIIKGQVGGSGPAGKSRRAS